MVIGGGNGRDPFAAAAPTPARIEQPTDHYKRPVWKAVQPLNAERLKVRGRGGQKEGGGGG